MRTHGGNCVQVLVQGPSRKDAAQLTGRTDANERVIFPDVPVPAADTTAQLFADMATWAGQVRPTPNCASRRSPQPTSCVSSSSRRQLESLRRRSPGCVAMSKTL